MHVERGRLRLLTLFTNTKDVYWLQGTKTRYGKVADIMAMMMGNAVAIEGVLMG